MSVYGASATRDRQGWLFGLSGPQFFLVMAAGVPTWAAMAMGRWIALLALVPLWAVVGVIVYPVSPHCAYTVMSAVSVVVAVSSVPLPSAAVFHSLMT